MNRLLILAIFILTFGISASYPLLAEDRGKHSGPEISVEQKSEQGLEHGKAYAGTREKMEKEAKEKKVKGESIKQDRTIDDSESKEKKEKKSKK